MKRIGKNAGAALFSAAAALLLTVKGLNAADIKAEISPGAVGVGGTAVITVSVEGGGDIEPVTIPKVDGLNIEYTGIQRSFQFINGRTWRGVNINFSVEALKKGRYTIPPFVFIDGGKRISTGELVLHVTGAPAGRSAPRQGMPGFMERRTSRSDVSVDTLVEASATKVYAGEPVILNYYALTDGNADIAIEGMEEQPEATGFILERIETPKVGPVKDADGRIKTRIYSFAAYPTRTGVFEPGGGSFIYSYDDSSGGFFSIGRRGRMRFDRVRVEVVPLPDAGRPDGFSGAVGDFSLEMQEYEENQELFGETRLVLTIKGEGSFRLLGKPRNSGGDGSCRVIVEDGDEDVNLKDGSIKGHRQYRVTIIPEKAGSVNAGRFEVDYFSLKRAGYETLMTGEVKLNVTGKAPATKPAGSAYEEKKEKIRFNPILALIILAAGIGAGAAVFLYERKRRRPQAAESVPAEEAQAADKHSITESDLRVYIDSDNFDGFFKAVSRLTESSASTAGAAVRERLFAARFGGKGMNRDEMSALLEDMRAAGLFR